MRVIGQAVFVIALLATGFAPRGVTGQRRPNAVPGGGIRFDRMRSRLDKNQDGEIARGEWQGPENVFRRMDGNGDGQVSKGEFEIHMQDRTRFSGPGNSGISPQPPNAMTAEGARLLLRSLDANQDGAISKVEMRTFFEKSDLDKDERLSPNELNTETGRLSSNRFSPNSAKGRMSRFQDFSNLKPALGQAAPMFELRDLAGDVHSLGDLLESKPVVIEFGSFT